MSNLLHKVFDVRPWQPPERRERERRVLRHAGTLDLSIPESQFSIKFPFRLPRAM